MTFRLKRADDVTVSVVDSRRRRVRDAARRPHRGLHADALRLGRPRRRRRPGARRRLPHPDHAAPPRAALRSCTAATSPRTPSRRARWSPRSAPRRSPGPSCCRAQGRPACVHLARRRARVRSSGVFQDLGRCDRGARPRGAAARRRDDAGTGTARRRAAAALSPGTYLVVVEVARRAPATSALASPLDRNGLPRTGLRRAPPGPRRHHGPLPRRPAAGRRRSPRRHGAPSSGSTRASSATLDAAPRRRPHRASLKRGRKTSARLRVTAPGGASGRLPLTVRTARARGQPCRSRSSPARAAARRARRAALMTWQGRNPVDDDGDGAPNLLDRGVPASRLGARLRRRRPARRASPAARRRCSRWLDRTGSATTSRPTLALAARRAARSSTATAACCCPATRAGCRAAPRSACGASCAAAGRSRRSAPDSLRREVALTPARPPGRPDRARADRPLRRASCAPLVPTRPSR